MIELHTSPHNTVYVNEKSISRFYNHYFAPRDRYEGSTIRFMDGSDAIVEETPEEIMRLIKEDEDK